MSPCHTILSQKQSFFPLGLALMLGFALFLLAASKTEARPEMGAQNVEARFHAMDTDKNGKVSREEFFAAQPQMKEGAFLAIDADKDNELSLEEWKGFVLDHGKQESRPGAGMGTSGMGGMGSMPARAPKDGNSTSTGPDAGKMPELIMPHGKKP